MELARKSASAASRSHCEAAPLQFGLYHLFWIFVICSVVGLAVETVVSYFADGMWENRAGLVWGPFSPIYGVGGVLMTVLLGHFAQAPALVLFAASALIGGAFEWVAGWFFESAFGIVAWSYIDQPFNIGGHTCLGIALVWGVAGLAWTKVALRPIVHALDQVPARLRTLPTAITCSLLAVDVALTLGAFECWFQRQAGDPVDTPVEQAFEASFGDAFMEGRFQTMSLYAGLAQRP